MRCINGHLHYIYMTLIVTVTMYCGVRNVRRGMERNRQKTLSQPQQQQSADETMNVDSDTAAETTTATTTDDDDAVRSTGAAGETPGMSSSGDAVRVMDDVECKFNVNSYQMIFVVNTESFLYRRHSLATARQVITQLHYATTYSLARLNIHYLWCHS